uniref:Uncharacterized protein n=1 Tax=Siphoviridae sp. ctrAf3 TaxID=2825687 RepID=A0A8S5PTU6_9CAUD|nr:MAG TPA: hypothetical protein [Siphoviridae sp. ctrAf3]
MACRLTKNVKPITAEKEKKLSISIGKTSVAPHHRRVSSFLGL